MIPLDDATEAALVATGAASHRIDAAVCLGSGLGSGADAVAGILEIQYSELPLLGECRVPGHAGSLRIGLAGPLNVAVFSGRRHFYETGDMSVAAGTARIAARLGARFFVSMSAVGGVDPSLPVGSWVYLTDHVNLMGRNPLQGVSTESGFPFVDLSSVYRQDIYGDIDQVLSRFMGISPGVLAAFSGPTYETPAEVRMAGLLGASVVGMSTVPEAVWAKWLGMEVCAWGLVANPAAGIGDKPLNHAEVLAAGKNASADAPLVVAATLAAWAKASGA